MVVVWELLAVAAAVEGHEDRRRTRKVAVQQAHAVEENLCRRSAYAVAGTPRNPGEGGDNDDGGDEGG